ncbi:MAG TPA: HAD-IA family hydrolase [Candidatus Saccharimonadales bacterium]|nr:HAD-IA family hydrolase [Candidatus Saccharimonadales bacterium]
MIKAVIFDFFGVVEEGGQANRRLLDFIQSGLKPKYKIAMISNSSGEGTKELLNEDQIELFDELIFSGEVGISKPHPSIFELAAKKLEVTPQECVFIDDSIGHCEGARAAGMQTIFYEDFEQMKQELEELLSIAYS